MRELAVILFAGAATALISISGTAMAGEPAKKMYRCGNLIQERPCEGPKGEPAAAKSEPAKQGPSQAALESRKKIRCENYDRQITELRDKETTEKNADLRKGLINQRLVLQGRAKSDEC